MKTPITYLFLCSIFLFVACSDETSNQNETAIVTDQTVSEEEIPTFDKQESMIDRPFEGVDIPFQTFTYDNGQTNVYEISTGSRIEIPKDAFRLANGKKVEGDITIQYREMHDLEDIMISGIKMSYEEADTSGDFESAGMFEIRAKSNGEELKLADGKKIKVDFASYKEGDFKSYAMNEATANWEFIEEKPAVKNIRKFEKIQEAESRLEELEMVCHVEPQELKSTDNVVDIDYNFNDYPNLEIFRSAMWIIAGGKVEENRFNRISQSYDRLEIEEADSCNYFNLKLFKKNNGEWEENTFLARPVWGGKAYKKAKKNYKKKIKEYNKLQKKLKRQRETAEKEADLVRSFVLKGMGIYNCDRIMNFITFGAASLVLICKEKIKNFFLITLNRQASIKFYNPTVADFKYDPNGTNSIIAVLPGNKVGVVSEKAFAKAVEKLKGDESDKLELELEIKPHPVKSKADLQNCRPRF
ncbi:MAG: hypothetical protein MI810_05405 [Flavobacteriales bacterium]|nr:hypothetical protein [Flavobacteriales bacterium]